ncbi:hypothetical protein D3C76_1137350 [compost metagenome]
MAKNRFGQFARVDVGLRFTIGVVWFQIVGVDPAIEADRFHARMLRQQQERLFGVGVDVIPVLARQLIGAITLRVQLARSVAVGAPAVAIPVLRREVTLLVDTDPVVATDHFIADDIAQFVVQRGQYAIHRVARVFERRVTSLVALRNVWLAIGNEERLVATVTAGVLEVLEPVGGGFERIFVVGIAAGSQLLQCSLQRCQSTIVGQVDREGGVDLGGEVHQQNIHRTRLSTFDTVSQGVEHRLQGFLRRVHTGVTHTG